MSAIEHAPAAPTVDAHPDRRLHRALWPLRDTWYVLRFLVFLVYLMLGIVSIWFWFLGGVLGFVRCVVRAAMLVLLRLSRSQGHLHRTGDPKPQTLRSDLQGLWDERLVVYQDASRRLAHLVIAWQTATRTFWHWSHGRKALALTLAFLFLWVPGLFMVPRVHEVQVTDDNATHYEASGQRVRYLVHAMDIANPAKTREYLNEDAWWLGKVNSQGLKSELKPGRYYRLWVVGVRWYYKPTMFPNIISATEITPDGATVEGAARFLKQTSTP